MSSAPYATHSNWSWPEETEVKPSFESEVSIPGSFANEEPEAEEEVPPRHHKTTDSPPRPRRHYPNRTCRICLEEVPPSFESLHEGVASMLNPTPKVQYISSDPSSGRLIRPCRCRGSQAYVHEGCLQEWRHADPAYGRRNYWECPTCKFRYRLERMKWSRIITSTITQLVLTVAIMLVVIFLAGFIADPILNLYFDPYETLTSLPFGGTTTQALPIDEDDDSWTEHFLKGVASVGLLGMFKVIFAMSPWQRWTFRNTGIGGGRRVRNGTGRDRLESISWELVILGLMTFLYAVWTWVRAWTRRTLEKAGERVADVHGGEEDEEEEVSNDPAAGSTNAPPEDRKTQ